MGKESSRITKYPQQFTALALCIRRSLSWIPETYAELSAEGVSTVRALWGEEKFAMAAVMFRESA